MIESRNHSNTPSSAQSIVTIDAQGSERAPEREREAVGLLEGESGPGEYGSIASSSESPFDPFRAFLPPINLLSSFIALPMIFQRLLTACSHWHAHISLTSSPSSRKYP